MFVGLVQASGLLRPGEDDRALPDLADREVGDRLGEVVTLHQLVHALLADVEEFGDLHPADEVVHNAERRQNPP